METETSGYDMRTIRMSQEIFYYLLEHTQIDEEKESELFHSYAENTEIQRLVKSQGDAAKCEIERYGDRIYLIPKEENVFLGYSKAQLRKVLCKSNAADRDYYLSQFAILVLLVSFYDSQGQSSKSRDYIRVGELQNALGDYLKAGAASSQDGAKDGRQIESPMFQEMLAAYEALKSDEKGTRAKTTKEGFLYTILKFLDKQGLVNYIEKDEMVTTTKKLDSFMDWNLLNQNKLQRVRRVLGVDV